MNVKNRKCIRKLSLKSLYANRRRNLIAIFAIALTTLLFTSMFTIVLSLNASYETYQFRQVGGYAHGTFKDVSPEQAERIAAHPKVKAAGARKVIGITVDGVFSKTPAEISYMDANCTKWSYATPTTGRMPESGKEVAMDTAALQLLGVTPELGAEVTVSYSITDKDQTAFTVTDTFTLVGYEDVYGSRYNYGGKNVVDYQSPELEYGQLSTTQTGVMEKIMLPGLQGISASGSGIYGISPGGRTIEIPGFLQGGSTTTPATPAFTELTQDFLLSNGAVGKISIPAIGVKNYYLWEGETTASMKKGLGHFTSTSVWNGNVAVCGHNRGAKYVIGSIKDLDVGDKITYTTSMGTRTYLVETVTKISSSDWSYLSSTTDNRMTLLTCVAGDSSQRWCVQAVQAS